MLFHNTAGHYQFLSGIAPYSCGAIADAGWEIVRTTPAEWLPWRNGFDWIDAVLNDAGLNRSALCAVELRSPRPFSMAGFIEFNREYCAVLDDWELMVDGHNPIARTNVAPVHYPPAAPVLHAFSYVRPNPRRSRPSFIVAGAGELRDGTLVSTGIVRRGETSPDALQEKAAYVLDVMSSRLRGLGVTWQQVNAMDVYTEHSLTDPLRALLIQHAGPALRHGLCWHLTQPPVLEIEFEMDVRGTAEEHQGQ